MNFPLQRFVNDKTSQSMRSDNDDSPRKCRERRRRRIQMRKHRSASYRDTLKQTSENQMENSGYGFNGKMIQTPPPVDFWSGDDVLSVDVPTFGTMSTIGRSREMEDALAVHTSLCMPEINHRRPVHFFAVYDGHGGSHVAALCRERMHVLLEGELMRVDHTDNLENGAGRSSSSGQRELQRQQGEVEGWKEQWMRVLMRSFAKMDQEALNTCACGSNGFQCGCHPMEVALGGSTAVVAVLTREHIIVANCGDSRAVLCRGGRAIPLSADHKPDRIDELARIREAGGRVIFVNGARVEGILAMSRAIESDWQIARQEFLTSSPYYLKDHNLNSDVYTHGDKFLKPFVSSEPEITFTEREAEDECLIIASDGLWDVLTSELACKVASECLSEGYPSTVVGSGSEVEDDISGALYPSRSVFAAVLLTRLALGHRSADNISVIVIDLKRCLRLKKS